MNNSTTHVCNYEAGNQRTSLSIAILFLVLGIAAFASNIFLDFIIWKLGLHRIVGHMFILSLSVSDLIQGILVSVLTTVELTTTETSMEFARRYSWCSFSAGINLLAIESTVYNILAISIDRMIAIFKPLRYQNIMSPRTAKISIAFIWSFVIVWSALPFLGWGLKTTCLRPPHAICDWGFILEPRYFLITASMVIGSLILVTIFQIKLIRVSFRQIRAIQSSDQRHTQLMNGIQARATRNVMLIVSTFAVSYLPWFALVMHTVLTGDVRQSYIYTCNLLLYVNSFVNPWIYAVSDRSIRRRMRKHLANFKGRAVTPVSVHTMETTG